MHHRATDNKKSSPLVSPPTRSSSPNLCTSRKNKSRRTSRRFAPPSETRENWTKLDHARAAYTFRVTRRESKKSVSDSTDSENSSISNTRKEGKSTQSAPPTPQFSTTQSDHQPHHTRVVRAIKDSQERLEESRLRCKLRAAAAAASQYLTMNVLPLPGEKIVNLDDGGHTLNTPVRIRASSEYEVAADGSRLINMCSLDDYLSVCSSNEGWTTTSSSSSSQEIEEEMEEVEELFHSIDCSLQQWNDCIHSENLLLPSHLNFSKNEKTLVNYLGGDHIGGDLIKTDFH